MIGGVNCEVKDVYPVGLRFSFIVGHVQLRKHSTPDLFSSTTYNRYLRSINSLKTPFQQDLRACLVALQT